ncbi:hypothetical protein J8J14_13725 [Roseomonas sp. SSH11]|uniref:Dicarboxylate transport domain-containing protein n=1 Tax=Pararoseomonas baculiformis TaxID=2820812 RepID=A0ABS4AG50_9PROT|nr:hypothetical protein [Pararoseomonas baculiformis]MBP0445834.1 hypothetical protein [Pararoseomonas baculiformis]
MSGSLNLIAAERSIMEPAGVLAALSSVEVTAQGQALTIDWGRTPRGANRAEVARAPLSLTAWAREAALGALALATAGGGYELTAPAGRRLGRVALRGLKAGTLAIGGPADLQALGLRLAISVPDGSGRYTPAGATPGLPASGLVPPLPTPPFSAGVLDLGGILARRIRLTLVTGDRPDSFAPIEGMALEGAEGFASDSPLDLALAVEGGAALWAFPGEMPAGNAAETDLRTGIETAMQAALDRGEPPRLALRLTASRPSTIGSLRFRAEGALLRRIAAPPGLSLAGEALSLAAGPGEAPPDGEVPTAASADLSIRYFGIRLVPELSDPPSGASGSLVAGHVVGPADMLRPLPPLALLGARLARIGVSGRAPEATTLLLTLQDGVTGAALGVPAKLTLPASRRFGTHWFALPDAPLVQGPLVVALRATAGRFLWAAREDGAPSLRLAVLDPDPGGRPVRIGSGTLLSVGATSIRRTGLALPPAAFAGAWPSLSSDLFLTLDFADLILRYAR